MTVKSYVQALEIVVCLGFAMDVFVRVSCQGVHSLWNPFPLLTGGIRTGYIHLHVPFRPAKGGIG